MKILIAISTIFACIISGCYKVNLSPKSDVNLNETGGFWKLSEYSIRGKSYNVSKVEPLSLIEIQSAIVKPDDKFVSSIFRIDVNYNVFNYNQNPEQKTFSVNALRWNHSYNESKKQETSWFKIDDNTGFLVILDVDVTKATSSKMQVSNIIKSSSYVAELDTIKYTYIPTSNWH